MTNLLFSIFRVDFNNNNATFFATALIEMQCLKSSYFSLVYVEPEIKVTMDKFKDNLVSIFAQFLSPSRKTMASNRTIDPFQRSRLGQRALTKHNHKHQTKLTRRKPTEKFNQV